MPKLRVHSLAGSLDGFAAGPDQDLDHPLGVGGERLHTWVFETRHGRAMIGEDGGSEGMDNDFLVRGDENVGATVMGRNMFGPVRGDWPDESWTGWWGEEPPYHHDVFEMHVAVVPVLLGRGERLLDGVPAGYEVVEYTASPAVAHYRIARSAD